jgi:hypothetical protein
MNNIRRSLLTFGLGAGLVAGNAFAGTITQTFTVNANDNVGKNTSVEVFNYFGAYALAGQSLTGVTLQFSDIQTISDLSVLNTTGSAQTYNINPTAKDTLQSGAGATYSPSTAPAGALAAAEVTALNTALGSTPVSLFGVGAPFDGSCDQNIANNATDTWFTAVNTPGSAVYNGGCGSNTNPSGHATLGTGVIAAVSINDFTGAGTFDLAYLAQSNPNISNSNITGGTNIHVTSQGTYTITYTYAPSGAPEPTTMFLLGSGLVGLGFLRRRATKS